MTYNVSSGTLNPTHSLTHRRWRPGSQQSARVVCTWKARAAFHSFIVFRVSAVFRFLVVFGCQYQCNWLPGKTRLLHDLLSVSSGTLNPTHSLTHLAVCTDLNYLGTKPKINWTTKNPAPSHTNRNINTNNVLEFIMKYETLSALKIRGITLHKTTHQRPELQTYWLWRRGLAATEL